MDNPLVLSGKGSKVLDINLPVGNYRLSWSAQTQDDAGSIFGIDLEAEKSETLVYEHLFEPDSGEKFARLPGGRHIFSVNASHLTWKITFEML